MQIKEAEEQTGLTRKSIRHYEECGLIHVEKLENGYKDYTENDIIILKKIKQLRILDFSIAEIHKYLYGDAKAVVENRLLQNQMNMEKALEIDKYLKELLKENEFKEETLLKEKIKEQLRMIQFNWMFGMCNLLVFVVVGIVTWGVRLSVVEDSFMWLVTIGTPFITYSLYQEQRRNKELKKEGKLIYFRTKMEYIQQLLRNIFSFLIGLGMVRECLFYVGKIDWFNTIGDIWICLFMIILMLILVIFSFVDSKKADMEYRVI